ncbi:stage V sporulation protein AD [Sedimentibacter sp. B4]|uniref:stage V sporulation protein AD n=1 Tax=Sedimentibacter sp. B4 TaxID=304766 RepID=UPI00030D8EF5|nr:stage V sporulation protein AD [Sedimentibacter sp. B4]
MKKIGKQTFSIKDNVFIRDTYTIVGKKEGQGPLGNKFHMVVEDDLWGEDSWEKSELKFQKTAVEKLMEANQLKKNQIDLMISGDLLNQITSSSFAARAIQLPYIGVYGACSTMALTMGLGSLLIDGGFAENIICVTSSHFCSAERQYRLPLEMGGQRHMSAQWTVTGSAAVWLSKNGSGGPRIKNVTFGKITDLGVKDANNMGAAMAPAAYDTLSQHIKDTGINYDLIVTGDLGTVGKGIVNKMFNEDNNSIENKYDDCGTIIFDIEKQDVHSGGSGCGCSATVFGAFLYRKLLDGDIKKLLFTSTGALHSPTATLQGESIPGIAHSVGIEI